MEGLLSLYPESGLREICAVNLTEMLADCKDDTIRSLLDRCPKLIHACQTPITDATAEVRSNTPKETVLNKVDRMC